MGTTKCNNKSHTNDLHRPGGEPLSICSNWNWGASSPSTPTGTGYRRRSSRSAAVVVDPGGGGRGPAACRRRPPMVQRVEGKEWVRIRSGRPNHGECLSWRESAARAALFSPATGYSQRSLSKSVFYSRCMLHVCTLKRVLLLRFGMVK
jgi:hypothetical protein